MARLYLVRHGEASAAWHVAADPGLSALGQRQAEEAARKLVRFGPLDILSSPLLRARETAAPTSRIWDRRIAIADDVAEIPSPDDLPLSERQKWLAELMQVGWAKAGAPQRKWREALIGFLAAQPRDVAIFSHFVAINVAVGAALGRDELITFRPANASITVIDAENGRLALIEQGEEATSVVR
jgi:broad specificity phosphatase PhoE